MTSRILVDALIGVGLFFLLAPVVYGVIAIIWSVGEALVIAGAAVYWRVQTGKWEANDPFLDDPADYL